MECLRHKKTSPAILITEDGREEREDLLFDRQVHLLITHELGLVAFPICAELLDPDFYRLIVNAVLVDTIICASFSPGVKAFHDTLLKGTAARLLQLYINTCSAKTVSRNGQVALPLGFVQVPCSDEEFQSEPWTGNAWGNVRKVYAILTLQLYIRIKNFMLKAFIKDVRKLSNGEIVIGARRKEMEDGECTKKNM